MAILISTPQDLHNIRNNLAGTYELENDIDLSGWNWTPIGDSTNKFAGNIDGKGFRIKNLSIKSTVEFTGLIGVSSSGTIKNLGLENVYVESNMASTGGLIGMSYSAISNCYVTGTVKCTDTTKQYTGGLIGRSYRAVENCYAQCTVSGGQYTGGLMGYLFGSGSIIRYNYSKSKVTGTTNTGVFHGYSGGSIGNIPTLTSNYFDKEFAGMTVVTTTGVSSKTTAEMKTQSTYTSWDFTNIWSINNDYPTLKVFPIQVVSKKETITINSYANNILSNSECYKMSIRNVDGYQSQIDSNAVQSHRSVRTGNASVDSFISPIYSSIYKESKTVKEIIGNMKPLEANTSILNVMSDIPIMAYVSVMESHSRASHEQNISEISYIENPSYCEVI